LQSSERTRCTFLSILCYGSFKWCLPTCQCEHCASKSTWYRIFTDGSNSSLTGTATRAVSATIIATSIDTARGLSANGSYLTESGQFAEHWRPALLSSNSHAP